MDEVPLLCLVIEDQQMVANLFKKYLDQLKVFKKVDLAYNSDSALDYVLNFDYEITFIDIFLADYNGIDLANKILSIKPKSKIIFCSGIQSSKIINACLKIGARGYISKGADVSEIQEAVFKVMSGSQFICQKSLQILISEKESNSLEYRLSSNDVNLTEREQEVLDLLMNEYSVPEIANALFISSRTVETHKKHILEKYGVKTMVGLMKKISAKKQKSHILN